LNPNPDGAVVEETVPTNLLSSVINRVEQEGRIVG
jgi:hypothetical protein